MSLPSLIDRYRRSLKRDGTQSSVMYDLANIVRYQLGSGKTGRRHDNLEPVDPEAREYDQEAEALFVHCTALYRLVW